MFCTNIRNYTAPTPHNPRRKLFGPSLGISQPPSASFPAAGVVDDVVLVSRHHAVWSAVGHEFVDPECSRGEPIRPGAPRCGSSYGGGYGCDDRRKLSALHPSGFAQEGAEKAQRLFELVEGAVSGLPATTWQGSLLLLQLQERGLPVSAQDSCKAGAKSGGEKMTESQCQNYHPSSSLLAV